MRTAIPLGGYNEEDIIIPLEIYEEAEKKGIDITSLYDQGYTPTQIINIVKSYPEKRGIIGELGAGIARSALMTLAGISSALGAEEPAKKLEEVALKYAPHPERSFIEKVSGAIGEFLPYIGMAVVPGGQYALPVVFGVSGYGHARMVQPPELKETPEGLRRAITTGALQAGLALIPAGRVATRAMRALPVLTERPIMRSVIAEAVALPPTLATFQAIGMWGAGKTPEEATIEALRFLTSQEMLPYAVVGAGLGTLGGFAERRREIEKLEKTVSEIEKETTEERPIPEEKIVKPEEKITRPEEQVIPEEDVIEKKVKETEFIPEMKPPTPPMEDISITSPPEERPEIIRPTEEKPTIAPPSPPEEEKLPVIPSIEEKPPIHPLIAKTLEGKPVIFRDELKIGGIPIEDFLFGSGEEPTNIIIDTLRKLKSINDALKVHPKADEFLIEQIRKGKEEFISLLNTLYARENIPTDEEITRTFNDFFTTYFINFYKELKGTEPKGKTRTSLEEKAKLVANVLKETDLKKVLEKRQNLVDELKNYPLEINLTPERLEEILKTGEFDVGEVLGVPREEVSAPPPTEEMLIPPPTEEVPSTTLEREKPSPPSVRVEIPKEEEIKQKDLQAFQQINAVEMKVSELPDEVSLEFFKKLLLSHKPFFEKTYNAITEIINDKINRIISTYAIREGKKEGTDIRLSEEGKDIRDLLTLDSLPTGKLPPEAYTPGEEGIPTLSTILKPGALSFIEDLFGNVLGPRIERDLERKDVDAFKDTFENVASLIKERMEEEAVKGKPDITVHEAITSLLSEGKLSTDRLEEASLYFIKQVKEQPSLLIAKDNAELFRALSTYYALKKIETEDLYTILTGGALVKDIVRDKLSSVNIAINAINILFSKVKALSPKEAKNILKYDSLEKVREEKRKIYDKLEKVRKELETVKAERENLRKKINELPREETTELREKIKSIEDRMKTLKLQEESIENNLSYLRGIEKLLSDRAREKKTKKLTEKDIFIVRLEALIEDLNNLAKSKSISEEQKILFLSQADIYSTFVNLLKQGEKVKDENLKWLFSKRVFDENEKKWVPVDVLKDTEIKEFKNLLTSEKFVDNKQALTKFLSYLNSSLKDIQRHLQAMRKQEEEMNRQILNLFGKAFPFFIERIQDFAGSFEKGKLEELKIEERILMNRFREAFKFSEEIEKLKKEILDRINVTFYREGRRVVITGKPKDVLLAELEKKIDAYFERAFDTFELPSLRLLKTQKGDYVFLSFPLAHDRYFFIEYLKNPFDFSSLATDILRKVYGERAHKNVRKALEENPYQIFTLVLKRDAFEEIINKKSKGETITSEDIINALVSSKELSGKEGLLGKHYAISNIINSFFESTIGKGKAKFYGERGLRFGNLFKYLIDRESFSELQVNNPNINYLLINPQAFTRIIFYDKLLQLRNLEREPEVREEGLFHIFEEKAVRPEEAVFTPIRSYLNEKENIVLENLVPPKIKEKRTRPRIELRLLPDDYPKFIRENPDALYDYIEMVRFITHSIAKVVGDKIGVMFMDPIVAEYLSVKLGDRFLGFAIPDVKLMGIVRDISNPLEMVKTAGHEIIHFIWDFLPPADRKLLLDKYGDVDKVGESFGDYLLKKYLPPNPIRRIFDWIADIIERLRNYFAGYGFTSDVAIYNRALAGKFARGEVKPEDIEISFYEYNWDLLTDLNPDMEVHLRSAYLAKIEEQSRGLIDRIAEEFYYYCPEFIRNKFSERNLIVDKNTKRMMDEIAPSIKLSFIDRYFTLPVFNKVLKPVKELVDKAGYMVHTIFIPRIEAFFNDLKYLSQSPKTAIVVETFKELVPKVGAIREYPVDLKKVVSEMGKVLDDEQLSYLRKSVEDYKKITDSFLIETYRSSLYISVGTMKRILFEKYPLNIATTISSFANELVALADQHLFKLYNYEVKPVSVEKKDPLTGEPIIVEELKRVPIDDRRYLVWQRAREIMGDPAKPFDGALGEALKELNIDEKKAQLYKNIFFNFVYRHIGGIYEDLKSLDENFYFPLVRNGGQYELRVAVAGKDELGRIRPIEIAYLDSERHKNDIAQRKQIVDELKKLTEGYKKDGEKYGVYTTREWIESGLSLTKFLKSKMEKDGVEVAIVYGVKAPKEAGVIEQLSPGETLSFINQLTDLAGLDLETTNRLAEAVLRLYADNSYSIARELRKRWIPEEFGRTIEGFRKDFDEVFKEYIYRQIGHLSNRFFSNLFTRHLGDNKIVYDTNPKAKELVKKYHDMIVSEHSNLASFVYKVRTLAAVYYLGLRISSALWNYINLFTYFLPEYARERMKRMTRMEEREGIKSYLGLYGRSFLDVLGAMKTVNNLIRKGVLGYDVTLRPEVRIKLREMDFSENPHHDRYIIDVETPKGKKRIELSAREFFIAKVLEGLEGYRILESTFMRTLRMEEMSALGKIPVKIIDINMLPFTLTERHIRTSSAVAIAEKIYEINKKDIIEARKRGEEPEIDFNDLLQDSILTSKELIERTYFDYTRANRPYWANPGTSFGAISTLPLTLRGYIMNSLSLMREWIGDKRFYELGTAMAVFFILGGLTGLPLFSDIVDTMERVFKYPFRVKAYNLLKNNVGETGADFVVKGVPYAIGLSDVATSIRIEVPLPKGLSFDDWGNFLFGVYKNAYERGMMGFKELMLGDYATAFSYLLPLGAGMPFQAYLYATRGLTTKAGKEILLEGEEYKLSTGEAILRGLGFRPAGLAKVQDMRFLGMRIEKWFDARRDEIYKKLRLAKGTKEFNEIMEEIKKFNKDAYEYQGLIPPIKGEGIRRALQPRREKYELLFH